MMVYYYFGFPQTFVVLSFMARVFAFSILGSQRRWRCLSIKGVNGHHASPLLLPFKHVFLFLFFPSQRFPSSFFFHLFVYYITKQIPIYLNQLKFSKYFSLCFHFTDLIPLVIKINYFKLLRDPQCNDVYVWFLWWLK